MREVDFLDLIEALIDFRRGDLSKANEIELKLEEIKSESLNE
jgi:hypothetical protein